MANVQFEDQQQYRTVSGPKGLEGMVIKWGLAKDRKSAQLVLIIIGVAAVVIAFGVSVLFGSERGPNAQTDAEAQVLIDQSLNNVRR